jgi:hypothetical protein
LYWVFQKRVLGNNIGKILYWESKRENLEHSHHKEMTNIQSNRYAKCLNFIIILYSINVDNYYVTIKSKKKNTGCPVTFEFKMNNESALSISMEHIVLEDDSLFI